MKFNRFIACLTVVILLLGYAFAEDVQIQTLPQLGDASEEILELKIRLKELDYYKGSKLTDIYNEKMMEIVQTFQTINGLKPDGLLTDETKKAIMDENARDAFTAPLINENNQDQFIFPKVLDDSEYADEDGFLKETIDTPFIYASREDGYWLYLSHDARIEIKRISYPAEPLQWFESEITLRGEEKLKALVDPNTQKLRNRDPRLIAEEYGVVFAVSDDFFGYRKERDNRAGIVIHDGVIMNNRTKKSGTKTTPNLDVIALFEDGSMKTYDSQAYTAKEFLAMEGLTDTWSFGPWLLSDGQINPNVLPGSGGYTNDDPRNAIGMIDNNHYLFLTVQGRISDSDGCRMSWLARRMQDLGCMEALNLDGGNSVALYFNGDLINKSENQDKVSFLKGIRALSTMIGVGKLEQNENEQ